MRKQHEIDKNIRNASKIYKIGFKPFVTNFPEDIQLYFREKKRRIVTKQFRVG